MQSAACLVVIFSVFLQQALFLNGQNLSSYEPIVAKIVAASLVNQEGHERMQYLSDTFGIRLAGSVGLANMIEWAVATIKTDGKLSNATAEPVPIQVWIRNGMNQRLWMNTSAGGFVDMGITALGGSIGTNGPLTGEAIVIRTFDEAKALGRAKIEGKIVVWNQVWRGYNYASQYRVEGAKYAAQYGAIASLTRSPTSFSLYTLHTGEMSYEGAVKKIPTACITVEDAELFQRMQDRGQQIVLTMELDCETQDEPGLSHNIIAELPGTTNADELVVIGGHIDAWTRGAQDDSANFVAAWEALNILQQLGLRPSRTIRLVGWTDEERHAMGSKTYFADHLRELPNTVFAIESDKGVFLPTGFHFQGTNESMAVFQQICDLMSPWYDLQVSDVGGVAEDIQPLANAGVPGASMNVAGDDNNGQYWWYHHARSDQASAVTHLEFNQVVSVFAAISYVLADVPFRLEGSPRLP